MTCTEIKDLAGSAAVIVAVFLPLIAWKWSDRDILRTISGLFLVAIAIVLATATRETPLAFATCSTGVFVVLHRYLDTRFEKLRAHTNAPKTHRPSVDDDEAENHRRSATAAFYTAYHDTLKVLLQTQGFVLGLVAATKSRGGVAIGVGVMALAAGVMATLILLSQAAGQTPITESDSASKVEDAMERARWLSFGLMINYWLLAYGLTCIASAIALSQT